MPATVIVNNMTVVHRSSSGTVMAFPDVCKTPSPAGPVPIPYPNVAMSSDTTSGASSVKADGNPIMIKSSTFGMSTGDEAGSALGVVSNKIKGKAYPKMYSFDVKADGENVFRLSDIMLQNGGSPTNTAPAAEMQPPLVALGGAAKDPEVPEVTRLSWSKAECACGDEVELSVKTKKLDGNLDLPVQARRVSPKGTLGLLAVPISGNQGKLKWLTRRGRHHDPVKVQGLQELLRGKTTTAKDLTIKAPGKIAKETVGPSKRYTPQYKKQMTPAGTQAWLPTGAMYELIVAYDIEVKKGELVVTRKMNFTLVGGARKPSRRLKQKWTREIEGIWDRQFKLHRTRCKRNDKCDCSPKNGCCTFNVRIRCAWGGGHGTVRLHGGTNDPKDWGGPKWWYSHDWWEGRAGVPATVRPHEFGHLLGMYDEYPEGACDPARKVTSAPSSVMSSGSRVYKRHIKEFHQWFEKKTKGVIGPSKLLKL